MTYRWREHVGPYYDHEMNRTYRTKAELEEWMEKCPVKRGAAQLLAANIATETDLATWQAEIDQEIQATVETAKASPWPDPSTLFENVY
jgi:pyruvate dehydrogenase E1 component alpha subunit